jgi:hypothetical protein
MMIMLNLETNGKYWPEERSGELRDNTVLMRKYFLFVKMPFQPFSGDADRKTISKWIVNK